MKWIGDLWAWYGRLPRWAQITLLVIIAIAVFYAVAGVLNATTTPPEQTLRLLLA